ncbi:MAG: transcriptional repressor [Dehalococcoidia bacterium]|nr:transcriptional repressor [Dehalococcoidia bacterium]
MCYSERIMAQSKELLSQLGEKGYRLTPQRLMILEQVEAADGHVSAEEILQRVRVRYSNLNISTVYRTLELLKELALVTETDMGDGRVRFHAVDKSRHHHLVCLACGQMTDLDEAELKPLSDLLLARHGFIADLCHIAIFGRCKNCA